MAEPTIGAQLRAIRLELGLTLEQLAEQSGVSVRGISDIERGVRDRPRRSTLDLLYDSLEVDAETRKRLAQLVAARLEGETALESVQPHRVLDFTGREAEYLTVSAHLAGGIRDGGARIAILSGPPGVGKSALAVEIVHREPASPPLYVDLLGPTPASGRSQLSVMQGLLRQVLDADEGDPPKTLDACIAVWKEKCAERERTVVLDNAASESQIRPVLAGGNLRVVITSRRSLAGIEDATRVHLEPLAHSDSVALLRRIVPSAQRTDADLAELARLCGDLPLALRIIANRIASRPAHSAADFVRRLASDEGKLRALVAGDLSAEATFRLSYDDLDEASASTYRALAVVRGPAFDVQLVAALVDDPEWDVEDRLDTLVDLGLLEFVGQSSYRLHDLLRAFALDELRRAGGGEAELLEARLSDLLFQTVIAAGSMFLPDGEPLADRPDWMVDRRAADAWVRRNHEHWWPALEQAAKVGRDREVLDVADAFHWYSDNWVGFDSWGAVTELAITAARNLGDKGLEATHLGNLAWSELVERGDPPAAIRAADRARTLAEEAGDDLALAWARYYKGYALLYSSEYEESAAALTAAAQIFDSLENLSGALQARSLVASTLMELGRTDEAIAASELVIQAAISDDEGKQQPVWGITVIIARLRIAECLMALGRNEDAYAEADRAREVAERDAWTLGLGRVHFILAKAALAQDRSEEAAAHIEAGIEYATANLGAGALAIGLRDELIALRDG